MNDQDKKDAIGHIMGTTVRTPEMAYQEYLAVVGKVGTSSAEGQVKSHAAYLHYLEEYQKGTYRVLGEADTAQQIHEKTIMDLQSKLATEQLDLSRKTGDELAQLQAKNQADALEREGKTLDAEILRIQTATEAKKAALDQQVTDALKAGTASQTFYNQIADEAAAFDAEATGQITAAQKKSQDADDQAMADRWAELQGKKKSSAAKDPFVATLLSSRFQGISKRDPVADNTARAAGTLEQIRDLLKTGHGGVVGDSQKKTGLILRV